jgi:hypothetical protein
MCSIERSRYPTLLQWGKPELQREMDVPALTILAVFSVLGIELGWIEA